MRVITDRRRFPTPIFSRYTVLGGRRKTVRRAADKKKHVFVDLYSTRLLVAVMSMLLLSCIDAGFTLSLIHKGKVVEANPFMAFLMNYGVLPFTIAKFTITASALVILCLFKNVNITRISLPIAVKVYIAIVAYEVYLFFI